MMRVLRLIVIAATMWALMTSPALADRPPDVVCSYVAVR